METIGQKLKERRIEQALSLEEMSTKTKLSMIQLKAIEDGNISFFKDDLSYLSYFVRYYANALGIDYDELRSQVDNSITQYTDAISVSKIKEIEKMQANIQSKTIRATKGDLARKRRFANVDFASISMLVIALLIVFGLGYTLIKVILPSWNKAVVENPIVTPIVPPVDENKPGLEEKPPVTEEPSVPGVGEGFMVTQVDPQTYHISNWRENDEYIFDFTTNVSTSLRYSLNDVAQTSPEARVYKVGEVVTFTTKASLDLKLTIVVGYPLNNTYSINGKEVEVDSSITGSRTPKAINFIFVGGTE